MNSEQTVANSHDHFSCPKWADIFKQSPCQSGFRLFFQYLGRPLAGPTDGQPNRRQFTDTRDPLLDENSIGTEFASRGRKECFLMKGFRILPGLAALFLAAKAMAGGYQDLDALDARIASTLGDSGTPVPLDRRIRLGQCPQEPEISPLSGGALQCAAQLLAGRSGSRFRPPSPREALPRS
jgi:hypothetical protein